jgi:1-acyl-sn-glycerol-3-phosphate acyltransferase
MLERANRGWRIVATAICFTLFGVGGLLLRFVAFPLLWLRVREPLARRARARALIRWMMVLFVRVLCGLGIMTLEVRGAERLERQGSLVLANHPTLIDVVLMIALIRNADCIVKGALSSNPFTRGPVAMAGFLRNSDGPGLVDEAIASVHAGSNLLIFPEGTRSTPRGEMRLQRGAANIAVRGALDITPVVIQSSLPFLTKGTPWWRVPAQRVHMRIEVRTDILIADFPAAATHPALAARDLTRFLKDYFSKELSRASA